MIRQASLLLISVVSLSTRPGLAADISNLPGAGSDSFKQECPTVKSYPSIFADSDDFSTVKNKITERLAKLGLEADWNDGFFASLFGNGTAF